MNRAEVMECINNLKVNGQKRIHSDLKDLCPLIKKLSDARAYQYFIGSNSMNQLLINELKIAPSTASELLKVARKFYDETGRIHPCFEGYDYSKLIKLAACGEISYLIKLHELGIINTTMSREEFEVALRRYR